MHIVLVKTFCLGSQGFGTIITVAMSISLFVSAVAHHLSTPLQHQNLLQKVAVLKTGKSLTLRLDITLPSPVTAVVLRNGYTSNLNRFNPQSLKYYGLLMLIYLCICGHRKNDKKLLFFLYSVTKSMIRRRHGTQRGNSAKQSKEIWPQFSQDTSNVCLMIFIFPDKNADIILRYDTHL